MTTFEVKRLKALYQLRLDIVEKALQEQGAVSGFALRRPNAT